MGGRTIAVLGNGLDIVYPAANRKIVDQVENNGAVISEFPFGTKPDAGNFPRRNRIISGLSHAIVVVEAGHRSGAILTALNAVDQNRDVFAVPGRVTDSKSVGCNRLIRNGAIPVRDSQHILEILNPRLHTPARPVQRELKLEMTEPEMAVYSVLSGDPKYVDDMCTDRTRSFNSTHYPTRFGAERGGDTTERETVYSNLNWCVATYFLDQVSDSSGISILQLKDLASVGSCPNSILSCGHASVNFLTE